MGKMISNSALIGAVVVIAVYYICLTTVLTNDQVSSPPETDLKVGRVQGSFDQCTDHSVLLNNSLQDGYNCSQGPLKNWNATACSNNYTGSNNKVNILISTTISSGDEYCGEKIARSLICAISTNLIENNIDDIQSFVTKEVFDKLKEKYGKNSNKSEFKIQITSESIGLCFPLSIHIEEQGQGHFVVKRLNFSNQVSKPKTVETQRKQLISKVINKLHNKLQNNKIEAKIYWRIKSPGSIQMKMLLRNLTQDQLNDIIGIRFIVNKVDECYQVIYLIHKLFEYEQDLFRDYIKSPKKSGYQSLHTIVSGDKSEPGIKFETKIEFQVRTFKMHYVAEHGSAAHFQYKKNQTDQAQQIGEIIKPFENKVSINQN